jgi:hypothetical protein
LPSFSHGFSQRPDSRHGGRSQANRDDHGIATVARLLISKTVFALRFASLPKSPDEPIISANTRGPITLKPEKRGLGGERIRARITFSINARLCLGVCDLMAHAGKRTCAVRVVQEKSAGKKKCIKHK